MAITAVNIGRNSTIEIDTADSTASMTAIGGIFTGSFEQRNNVVDTTNNDDGGYTSSEYGNASCSLSFSCRYDPTDSGQSELEGAANLATRLKKEFRVRPIVGSGESQWVFTGLITGVTRNPGGNEDAVNFDVTIESTGSIAFSTQ